MLYGINTDRMILKICYMRIMQTGQSFEETRGGRAPGHEGVSLLPVQCADQSDPLSRMHIGLEKRVIKEYAGVNNNSSLKER